MDFARRNQERGEKGENEKGKTNTEERRNLPPTLLHTQVQSRPSFSSLGPSLRETGRKEGRESWQVGQVLTATILWSTNERVRGFPYLSVGPDPFPETWSSVRPGVSLPRRRQWSCVPEQESRGGSHRRPVDDVPSNPLSHSLVSPSKIPTVEILFPYRK